MSDAPEPPAPESRSPIDDALLRRVARWLPFALAGHLVVGLPALLISLVVAYGTYVQARATQRMQQAATWPYVAYGTSNYTADGVHGITLGLTNNGVGPALLEVVEMRYRGVPVRTAEELLAACCGYRKGEPMALGTFPLDNAALRPGERVEFFTMRDAPDNARMLPALERERWKLDVKACYCSIFGDCWTIRGLQAKPQPVDACPTGWVRYRER